MIRVKDILISLLSYRIIPGWVFICLKTINMTLEELNIEIYKLKIVGIRILTYMTVINAHITCTVVL